MAESREKRRGMKEICNDPAPKHSVGSPHRFPTGSTLIVTVVILAAADLALFRIGAATCRLEEILRKWK